MQGVTELGWGPLLRTSGAAGCGTKPDEATTAASSREGPSPARSHPVFEASN
jgi:hypothetical protein